jgi:hypothetical protein
MKLSQKIIAMIFVLLLYGCSTGVSVKSQVDILMSEIHTSLPIVDKNAAIVSLRYDLHRNTLTAIVVDKEHKKEYTIDRITDSYDISLIEDIDDTQIERLMKCNKIFDSVYIDPVQAINVVNKENNINQDLAVISPYLAQDGECKNLWSIHGPNGFYTVDAANGKIISELPN